MISPLQANATSDTGWGGGGAPTEGGAVGWVSYTGEKWSGVPGQHTSAWNNFLSKQQALGKHKNIQSLINGLSTSKGFKNEDGSYQSLSTSCQRSQHIWIYADPKTYEWFTRAGRNDANPPKHTTGPQEQSWEFFTGLPSSQTGWGTSRGPVIVCSGTFEQGEEEKGEIVLKANSGTFKYDGTPKTVKGFTHVSGKLTQAPHYIDAKAESTRTAVGSQPVTFQYARIIGGGGVDVSNKYESIKTIDGVLTITPGDPDLPPDEELYRCVPEGGDRVGEIIVQNILKVVPVYIPETAGAYLPPEEVREFTPARDIMDNPPSVGQTISAWNAWKASIEAVGNEREIGLELSDYHMETLSSYGGVLDVLIEHERENFGVQFCQPQTRTKYYVPITDSKGNVIGSYPAYTPWVNSGEKLINKTYGPNPAESLEFSYQILAVNCNAEEFNQLLGALGGKVAEQRLIEPVGAGMLQTKIEPHSPANLVLGRTTSGGIIGKTGTTEFYTEGETCKENGLCTADKLLGALNFGHHDAINNHTPTGAVIEPLFTYYNLKENSAVPGETEAGHGLSETIESGEKSVVFFRDNVNRVVRADLWRLIESNDGFIIDETMPPVQTIAKLFEGGSPDISITTIQPLAAGLNVPNGEGYIDHENESHNGMQNGGAKLSNNPSFEEFYPGGVNRFNFKSQWTSDTGDPYKLGLTWLYEITLERNVLTEVTNTSTTFTKEETEGVEIACQFYNTPGSRNALINSQPHVYPVLDESRIEWEPSESVKVIFSRSISEKRNN